MTDKLSLDLPTTALIITTATAPVAALSVAFRFSQSASILTQILLLTLMCLIQLVALSTFLLWLRHDFLDLRRQVHHLLDLLGGPDLRWEVAGTLQRLQRVLSQLRQNPEYTPQPSTNGDDDE
ncbi:unnamed protein product [marine sediment metagenome]|uniref:Uncharacterized protein n=1 Tax=marine sediment metagenome TaxID=412755 RepID=X0V9P1_9ZZZZ